MRVEYQHFVPKFIIKKWVNEHNKVQMYFHNGHRKLMFSYHPQLVLRWPNLYSLSHLTTQNGDNIQGILETAAHRNVEGRMDKIIRRWERLPYQRLTLIEDPEYLPTVALLRLTFFRHPSYFLPKLPEYVEFAESFGINKETIRLLGVEIGHKEDISKFLFSEFLASSPDFGLIKGMRIFYYKPRSRLNLLLSDHPFMRTFPENRTDYMGNRLGVITMPIAPKMAIIATNAPEILNHVEKVMTDNQIVRSMNREAISTAKYCIIDKDEQQSTFIENNFNPTHYFDQATKVFSPLNKT